MGVSTPVEWEDLVGPQLHHVRLAEVVGRGGGAAALEMTGATAGPPPSR